LYDGVAFTGDQHGEPELRARALLGKGVTARVRGNYPKARKHLSDGLACAMKAGLSDLAAVGHQGLLIAAATAGDHDTALVHGWAAFELADGNCDRQAEILINLAQVSLLAGQARAARSGFLASMSRSDQLRFRLPCIGGAAVASATLDDERMLTSLARTAEESIAVSALPFESASLLRSLYDAYGIAGHEASAEAYRLRARALARKNGFFEIVLATDTAGASRRVSRPATAPLSEDSMSVIHSLESLETEPVAAALALTP
jgi:hypothetical protein